jgi:hypothetical protein
MRQLISNNTNKPPTIQTESDVEILPDGEGGIYLSLCWHKMIEVGSMAAHIPSHRISELLNYINLATEDKDQ